MSETKLRLNPFAEKISLREKQRHGSWHIYACFDSPTTLEITLKKSGALDTFLGVQDM